MKMSEMKMNLWLSVSFALGMSLSSVALAADNSNGCGLGWAVTQKTSLLATTTRNTTAMFLPPTFSMTSGTSGCAKHSIAKNDFDAARLIATQGEAVKMEMASGRGELLSSLGRTLGCGDQEQGFFQAQVQSNYGYIADSSSEVEMVQRLRERLTVCKI
jgi:hypothetical protein